jgi:hypothetical protein
MATSHYFSNFTAATINQQRLLEDLVTESIKIMGHDVWFIPRESFNGDDFLLGENAESKFERAYMIDVYLPNVSGYEGEGDFFSKFGLEVRDTSNFVVSRKTFERYVPPDIRSRPREGDLLFVPVLNKLVEIKFIEEELLFFSLGKRTPFIYEMRTEVFRASNELINTGVSEIDVLENANFYNARLSVTHMAGNTDFYIGEVIYQGANLVSSSAQAEVSEWDRANSYIYIINIKGVFQDSANVTGSGSHAIYNVTMADTMGDYVDFSLKDNKTIQTDANNLIDTTESNPFGNP